jgi:hypothetical protein
VPIDSHFARRKSNATAAPTDFNRFYPAPYPAGDVAILLIGGCPHPPNELRSTHRQYAMSKLYQRIFNPLSETPFPADDLFFVLQKYFNSSKLHLPSREGLKYTTHR